MNENPYQQSVEQMVSKNTELLVSLGPEYAGYRAYLESVIPVFDGQLQSGIVPDGPIMQILLAMNQGLQSALYEIDTRLMKLEDQ